MRVAFQLWSTLRQNWRADIFAVLFLRLFMKHCIFFNKDGQKSAPNMGKTNICALYDD